MKNYLRLREIEFLQSFSIILVVIGHSLIFMNNANLTNSLFIYLHQVIYSFHMPLFMSVAGFLFIHSNLKKERINYQNFISKKFKRLIVPYVAISSFAFIPKALLQEYALRPINLSFGDYIHNLVYPWDNVILNFWFLPTLFIIFLIFACLFRNPSICRNSSFILFISFVLLIVHFPNFSTGVKLLNLSGVFHYLIYFWIGVLLRVYKNYLKILENKLFCIFLFSLVFASAMIRDQGHVFRMCVALAGILFSYSLAYVSLAFKKDVFSYINGFYYQIFLLSWFFENLIRVVLYQFFGFNYYFVLFLLLISGLFLPVLLTKLILKRASFLKPIIGL